MEFMPLGGNVLHSISNDGSRGVFRARPSLGQRDRAHPGAYLARRADALASILQIRGVYYPFHTGIAPNDLGLEFVRGPVYDRVTSWLYDTRGFFFRGWLFGWSRS